MTTAQVVETSVTVNNSPIQDYVHPDDQTQPTFDSGHCFSSLSFVLNVNKSPAGFVVSLQGFQAFRRHFHQNAENRN